MGRLNPMEYWQEGHKLARLSAPEAIPGEVFNWRTRTWQPDSGIGIEIRFSGENWERIPEAHAVRLTRTAIAG